MSETPLRPNFLGRLVDEAFGVEPVLQPRKQSLFELAPAAWLGQDEQTGGSGPANGDAPLERRLMGSDPAPREIEEPHRDFRPRSDEAEEPSHIDARPLAPPDAQAPPDIAPPERAEPPVEAPSLVPARPASSVAPPAPVARRSLQVNVEAPAHVASREGDAAAGFVHDPVALEPQVAVPAAARRSPAQRALPERIARETRPSVREGAAALLAKPIAQEIIAQFSPQAAPTEAVVVRPKTAQGPTVVNVTIGRVEVRAAHAQAPARSVERRGQKPLSLDDYLKRRTGQ